MPERAEREEREMTRQPLNMRIFTWETVRCPRCGGTGNKPTTLTTFAEACSDCSGSGRRYVL